MKKAASFPLEKKRPDFALRGVHARQVPVAVLDAPLQPSGRSSGSSRPLRPSRELVPVALMETDCGGLTAAGPLPVRTGFPILPEGHLTMPPLSGRAGDVKAGRDASRLLTALKTRCKAGQTREGNLLRSIELIKLKGYDE